PPVTFLQTFQERARRNPQKVLLRFQDETYTYGEAEGLSNRLARVLQRRLALWPSPPTVAVLLPNCPGYVWAWLALAKLGWPMACVNCNTRGRALLHAMDTAGATALLAGTGEGGTWG
ncbi:S27A2 synthetase, partial [Brachypteracias leptosomus]|nr:S27A2 synthetase [Brachypteracias leptosomus]